MEDSQEKENKQPGVKDTRFGTRDRVPSEERGEALTLRGRLPALASFTTLEARG